MIRTRLRAPAAVLAASLALLAAGCSSSASDQTQAGGTPTLAKVGNLERTTLNVAAVPAMDSAGFFIAMHEGLFKQEGLTINYSASTSSETAIGSQEKGTYDITAGNYVSYIEAAAQGAPLQIIAEGSVMLQGAQVVLTMPKYHITTLSDLRGHTLAVNAAGNIDFLLDASALTEHGIPVNTGNEVSPSEVNFNSGVPFPDMAQALASGEYKGKAVNAVTVPEPFASILQENLKGATAITDLNQGATTQFPIEGYVVTKSWAKANPNTLKAFLTALEVGQQIADTNRAEVEAAFESLPSPQTGQVTPLIASMMALDNYPLGVDKTRLQRVANVMRQFGVLRTQFNIQNMLG